MEYGDIALVPPRARSCMDILPKRVKRQRQVSPPDHVMVPPSFVVIGGGIAGVCCAQELARNISDIEGCTITLVSSSGVLKESRSVMKISNNLEEIAVYERRADYFRMDNPVVSLVEGSVNRIDTENHSVHLLSGTIISYSKLCICTGAVPSLLLHNHPNVIGIRDMESVDNLASRLREARRVAVVGNGGIALELVHTLTFCDICWIVRDSYMGNTFFDASASAFVIGDLHRKRQLSPNTGQLEKTGPLTDQYRNPGDAACGDVTGGIGMSDEGEIARGGALGPEWVSKTGLVDKLLSQEVTGRVGSLQVQYEQEVSGLCTVSAAGDVFDYREVSSVLEHRYIEGVSDVNLEELHDDDKKRIVVQKVQERNNGDETYPLYICTTQGKIVGCDFVVSATGVSPTVPFLHSTSGKLSGDQSAQRARTVEGIDLSWRDGSIMVDECFQTSVDDVFAAGDCCTVEISEDGGEVDMQRQHWFQMRLWSQARAMGLSAAHAMISGLTRDRLPATEKDKAPMVPGNMFNIFAHVTHFFGYKVVLLGKFNGQGLGETIENCVKEMVVTPDGLVRRELRPAWSQGRREDCCEDGDRQEAATADCSVQREVEVWTRVTPGEEYIKLVVQKGKIVGALLIGDTDLEEVFENLILNELDVSRFGADILNPDIDVEAYFD